MDRFSEIRAFAAVVEAGGFAAAARELGQSRSAVNRLVIALEERLGVQLLHRTTRSVSANSTGRALYQRARRLLDDLEDMESAVASAQSEPVGRMRLSVPLSFGRLDFAAMLAGFMRAHPKVEIEVSFDNRFVDPVAEGFDAVVRVATPDEETSLVDHRILTLDYLLCAAPSYLAARGTPTVLKDLGRHAVLFHQQSMASPEWRLEGPDGPVTVALRPVLAANNLGALLPAAVEGLGIAMLPAYAVREALSDDRLRQVLPDHRPPPRMLQVIYPPSRHLSAKVRLFNDFLREWCIEE
ncbi:MAG: LysR family transcriptional regulator [Pseudomonadota bacterium]